MDPDQDNRLIERIGQGDADALAAYIEAHRGPLAGFVQSITGDRLLSVVEIDDLMQEISAAAIAGLATAPLKEYEPMQWLRQVARRRVVDAHRFHFDAKRRDAGRQQSIHAAGSGGDDAVGLEALLAASLTSATAAVSRDFRMQRLDEAIAGLGDEQRAAVRMRYAEGLPTKQIAQRLGKTDVAVRVLLSRSMKVLEQQLQDVRPTR